MDVRIVSLVPSATEMLFALELGADVVGVTHECDYPPEAEELAKVTRDRLEPGLSAAEIDRAVREYTERGEAIYELDREALHDLRPDLIVTQAVCAVCAVSYDDVRAVAEGIETNPQVISLDPQTLGEVLADVRTLAAACDAEEEGDDLLAEIADRIDRVKLAVRARPRPRVAALEWLDPVFVGGHWVPQMIDYAGGDDVLGQPGERSETVDWALVAAAQPDVVVAMPCGYDAPRAAQEARDHADRLATVAARQVVAVNASAYFSRPGPRLVDGLELLAWILHPEAFPGPPAAAAESEQVGLAAHTG